MKKILVIGYGGTIVMVVDKERKSVKPAEDVREILELLPNLSEVAEVDFDVLSNVDSTNVTPPDWTKIAYHIHDKMDEYDGFVITHGTNTMSYTASALSLALGPGLKKPVIITGSQLPLTVYGNDARFNFENSIKTAVEAKNNNIAEVMIVFNDVILRGSRSMKVSESAFHAFDSPAFPPIGHIRSTGIHFNHHAKKVDSTIRFELSPHFEPNVLTVDLVPGIMPNLVEEILKSGKCKGVILKSHGAGSVPTVDEYSFLPLIKKATQGYKVPVLIATKFLGGNATKDVNDEPAIQALEAGAISTLDTTDVMSQVKLMWLLAKNFVEGEKLVEAVHTDYIGEVTAN